MAPDGYVAMADLIVQFLLYEWDRPYVTAEVLRDALPERYRNQVANVVRWIITAYEQEVLDYADGCGTYQVRNLERYFEPVNPGASERWWLKAAEALSE